MNNFPKGNDLIVKWAIKYSDGTPFPLENYAWELCYSAGRGINVVKDTAVISVSDNLLTWRFSGKDQAFYGKYSLTLRLYQQGKIVATVRKNNAFELSTTQYDGPCDIDLVSYCDNISLQDALLRGNKAMEVAQDAKNIAGSAVNTAGGAVTTANEAKTIASTANNTSTEAKTIANNAKTVADQAKVTADATAATATQKAEEVAQKEAQLEAALNNLSTDQSGALALSTKVNEHGEKLSELDKTLGYGLCEFNVTQGSSHSSNLDRINVDIKAGEKFYISGTMLSGNVTAFYIFVKYTNQVSTVNIGLVNVGQGYKKFIASNDIESLGYYIEGSQITASGQISIVSLSGIYAKSQETKFELEAKTQELQELNNNINKQFVMVDITDALAGSYKNITLNTSERKVTIKSQGLRLKALGKSFTLSGATDFVMPYTSDSYPNGAWLLSTDAVKNVADGGNIELSSENIYYLGVNAPNYRKDITLFPCYYGDIIATGLFGNLILSRQIEAITPLTDVAVLMRDNAFNSVYNPTDITVKQKEYTALINNTGKTEQFIFFTDPHLLGSENTFSLPTFKQYIGLLQKYYNCLPVDFVLSGGDWLNSGDYQVTACDKLGYMDATMRKLFKRYYPVLGNHDTNYQGVVSADDSTRGDLSQQTIINLMFRENKNAYYDFIGNNTRFFVFDTQIDWETTLNVYKYQQLKWFAESLTNNKDENIVIVQHIFYTNDQVINPISEKIQDIAGAFNSRTTITIDGQQYDFTNCNGYIRCAIAGHSHTDEIITNTNVPVVLTANMQKENTPTFDICLIDYGANKMYLVRVGTGVSRELDLFVGNK